MTESDTPILTPRDVIAATSGAIMPVAFAERALSALARAGYSVVPTAGYDDLLEMKAEREGRFPRCFVVKPGRDRDFYVGWSDVVEAPVWAGTRAEALADGCPESRLRRADETGTSALMTPAFYRWDSAGMVAEQRGFLPRARLAGYVTAYMAGRTEEAYGMLEPFDDDEGLAGA